jgi:plastocyanin
VRRFSICLVALLSAFGVPVTAAAQPSARSVAAAVQIAAFDNYYVPPSPVVPRGGTVVFDFGTAYVHHSATDDSGLELYDSGDVAGGGPSFSYTFVAAGVYPFYCVFHPEMRGRVRVPMRIAPARGPRGRIFKLVWASVDAPVGQAYDVQIRRPGARWAPFLTLTGVRSTSFTPHVHGTFRFRARLHDTTADTTADWSDPVSLDVV